MKTSTKTSKSARHGSGSVRIIGGRWRRRRIPVPADDDLRPTPDRLRETLFNWLMPRLPGAVCLDLFAGSGVLGLEAVSRGAARAVLVDRSAGRAEALERLRESLAGDPAGGAAAHAAGGAASDAAGDAAGDRGAAQIEIVCADAIEYLSDPGIETFDIAFVDPPYAMPAAPVLRALMPRLNRGARVYLERDRADPWPELGELDWLRTTTAGAVAYGLAELKPPAR